MYAYLIERVCTCVRTRTFTLVYVYWIERCVRFLHYVYVYLIKPVDVCTQARLAHENTCRKKDIEIKRTCVHYYTVYC